MPSCLKLLLASLIFPFTVQAQQVGDCDGVLQKAKIVATSNAATAVATVAATSSDTLSNSDVNRTLGFAYGGANLDLGDREIAAIRQAVASQFRYDYSHIDQKSFIASYLQPDALAAWVKCKTFGDNNAHAVLFWRDATSVAASPVKKSRVVDVTVLFVGSNEVLDGYSLDLRVNGTSQPKLLPTKWGFQRAAQTFSLPSVSLSDPLSIVANFRLKDGTPRATADVIIPPVLPTVRWHLDTSVVKKTETGAVQCKGPGMVFQDLPPVTVDSGPTIVTTYFRNPSAVMTGTQSERGEAHPPSNAKVIPSLSDDRQVLGGQILCQGISANGDALMAGYVTAQQVKFVIDGIDYP